MAELLLSCQGLTKAFGSTPLFEELAFGVFEGDHVGLVGPNGSGKSTLLRILAGLDEPSAGTRAARKRLRVGYVPQDPSFAPEASVKDVLCEGLLELHLEEHQAEARLGVLLGKAGFVDPAQTTRTLSGGWKKRLAIARELAREPELLLLDEPTNHLDVDGIVWLEELLKSEPEAFLAISHDRYFLENVAARVIELNRVFPGGLLDVAGSYSRFLEKKDELLAGQAAYQDALRNRVRGELAWLARGAKARTRKAQARIDVALRMQDDLVDLDERSRTQSVGIEFAASERKTKRLVVAEGIAKRLGERELLRDLDLVLSPGLRLGLLGANGSGKSTLLRLLAGLDTPDAGSIERAPNLRVVMFDQQRSRLDPQLSLKRTLAPYGDAVVHQGRSLHVAGWAKRFLFTSEQLETPVGRLSGGEQARVLIAKLMLEPADLLLLDEPTNDLDIPTLEVLEESLLEFPGALVLVTHDRYLLDRVSTRILALDGQGGAMLYADYGQWELGQRLQAEAAEAASRVAAPARSSEPAERALSRPRKLGYLDQREWEQMEARILEAEADLEASQAAAADPAIASDPKSLHQRLDALSRAHAAVEQLYARWAELEAKFKG